MSSSVFNKILDALEVLDNMFGMKKIKILFNILGKMVYFCTLGIGVYFIYEGEVVQRFQRRRTNFAHYEEQVSELPIHTISVWTKNKTFKFGEDYHLQFRQGAQGSFHTAINLTYGDNRIPENNLSLTIDNELEDQRSLKISFAKSAKAGLAARS